MTARNSRPRHPRRSPGRLVVVAGVAAALTCSAATVPASAHVLPGPPPVPPVVGGLARAVVRNPLLQPFSSTSIWNTPIGSGARFVPAGLEKLPSGQDDGKVPQIDDEPLVLTPTAPPTPIQYSAGAWSGSRCTADPSRVLATVPIPADYVLPTDNKNQSAAILAADGRTVVNPQPLARCRAGGPATSLVRYPDTDLYGDGIDGSHGGSGMSALGGSIRLGELRPGQQGPHHVLKVNLYARGELYRCRVKADCSRWPARKSDSYAVGIYGSVTNNQNRAMKMGSLLAIPPTVDITRLGLKTGPGRELAWTLQNYGAYVVDDTFGPSFALDAEVGPAGSMRTQFRRDWGYDFEADADAGSPWGTDVQRIRTVLAVVDNNTPTSVGGGGVPRQPLLPPLVPPVVPPPSVH